MSILSFVGGASAAVALRALLAPALRLKFSRDVARLDAGDPSSLLRAYADDAVLRFNVGDHRFSGAWTGRAEIERFLQNFAGAGVRGEIKAIATSGPPWAMTLWARFDDRVVVGGETLYENRSTIVLRTRWGKVVDHEDFWVDTAPIERLEAALRERGIPAVPKHP